MRYFEIIEASKPDPEHDRDQRARARDQLNTARHKRSRAAQTCQDQTQAAADQERKAKQRLAEADPEQPDYDTERKRWQHYWANQKRIERALAADAEKRSRGMGQRGSFCLSEPAWDGLSGCPLGVR